MQAFLITQLARFLTSVSFWQQAKDMVTMYEDKSLTGYQKKQRVMIEIKKDAVKFGDFLISLVIELAVAYFKAKSGALK